MTNSPEFNREYGNTLLEAFRPDDLQRVLSYVESFFSPSELAEFKAEAQRRINERLAMDIAIRELDAEYAAKQSLNQQ